MNSIPQKYILLIKIVVDTQRTPYQMETFLLMT